MSFKFTVTYDTNVNTDLDPGFKQEFIVNLGVANTVTVPVFSPATAQCGGTPCLQTLGDDIAGVTPQYRVTNGVGVTVAGDPVANAGLTNSLIRAVANQNQNILIEGTTPIVEVPITANIVGGANQNIVYSYSVYDDGLAAGVEQCSYLFRASNLGIRPVRCQGTNAAPNVNDCLELRLNYDPVTGLQAPLPYFTPRYCHLSIKAHSSTNADAYVTLFGTNTMDLGELVENPRPLTLYFADVNSRPVLLSNVAVPTSLRMANVATVVSATNPLTGVVSYPIENQSFDLMPSLQSLFYDQDMGVFNNSQNFAGQSMDWLLPNPLDTTNPTIWNIANLATVYYMPIVHVQNGLGPSTTSREYRVSENVGVNPATAITGSNLIYDKAGVAYVEIVPSATFAGTINFGEMRDLNFDGVFDANELNIQNVNLLNITASAINPPTIGTSITCNAGLCAGQNVLRLRYDISSIAWMFQAQLTAVTAGNVTISVHSNYSTEKNLVNINDSISYSLRGSSSPRGRLSQDYLPSSYLYASANGGVPYNFSNMYITPQANSSNIKFDYMATAGILGGNSAPTVSAPVMARDLAVATRGLVLNPYFNVDPREITRANAPLSNLDCYISVEGAAAVPCNSQMTQYLTNSPMVDMLNASTLGRILPGKTADTYFLRPSYAAASNGNLSSSVQRNSRINLIMRYRNHDLARQATYSNTFCNTRNCVDHTLALPVIEERTAPTIQYRVLRGNTLVASGEANRMRGTGGSVTPATVTVQENQNVTLELFVRPFNDAGISVAAANANQPNTSALYQYNVSFQSCTYAIPSTTNKNCATTSRGGGNGIYADPASFAGLYPDSNSDGIRDGVERFGNMVTDGPYTSAPLGMNNIAGQKYFRFVFAPSSASNINNNTTGRGDATWNGGNGLYSYTIRVNPVNASLPDTGTTPRVSGSSLVMDLILNIKVTPQ